MRYKFSSLTALADYLDVQATNLEAAQLSKRTREQQNICKGEAIAHRSIAAMLRVTDIDPWQSNEVTKILNSEKAGT